MKTITKLLSVLFLIMLIGMPHAAVWAADVSEDEPAAETTESAETEEIEPVAPDQILYKSMSFEQNVQRCIQAGGPIELDDFYFSALEQLDVMGNIAFIAEGIKSLMACRQLESFNAPVCNMEDAFTGPYFTQSTGEYNWDIIRFDASDLSEQQKQQMLTYARNTIIDRLSGLTDSCKKDSVFNLLAFGAKAFPRNDFVKDLCGLYPESISFGVDCVEEMTAFIHAIDNGNPEYCDGVLAESTHEMCLLLASKDPAVCKSAKTLPADFDQCRSYLTAFKLIRNLSLAPAETLAQTQGSLATAVKLASNPNACDAIYKEQVLHNYCWGKYIRDKMLGDPLNEDFKKRDVARQEQQAEADKKTREAYLKRLEEEKAANEAAMEGGTEETEETESSEDGGE